MLPSFYIQVEYTLKNATDGLRTIKAGVYVDNYAWDEFINKLFIGNNFFDEVTKLTIRNADGEVVLKFEDKLGVKIVA